MSLEEAFSCVQRLDRDGLRDLRPTKLLFLQKNEDGETLVHAAARSNAVDILRYILEFGVDLSITTDDGMQPIHFAAQCGCEEATKYLCGIVNVQPKAPGGWTPLLLCVDEGQAEVCQILLDCGASLEETTEDGYNVIHLASIRGDVTILGILLRHASTTNTRDFVNRRTSGFGYTPAHLACHHGNIEALQFLHRNGHANILLPSLNGESCLYVASRRGDTEICSYLLDSKLSPLEETKDGRNSVHVASEFGHLHVLSLFENQFGALEVRRRGIKEGNTALHLAAANGQDKVIPFLLKLDAPVNALNDRSETPLYLACANGHKDAVKSLLENGASPNKETMSGYVPIHAAAAGGHTEVLKELWLVNASLKALTPNEETPLHLAAEGGYLDAVQFMCQHSANPRATTLMGHTALCTAVYMRHAAVVKYLAPSSPCNTREVLECVIASLRESRKLGAESEQALVEILKIISSKGFDLMTTTPTGCNLAHYAVLGGQLAVLRFLKVSRVEFNTVTKRGHTILHYAIEGGHMPTIKYIRACGVDVYAEDDRGWTALHLACYHGDLEAVKYLITLDADAEATTQEGYTPYHLAVANNHEGVASYLDSCGASVDTAGIVLHNVLGKSRRSIVDFSY
eukprot:Rmarinus@m.16759